MKPFRTPRFFFRSSSSQWMPFLSFQERKRNEKIATFHPRPYFFFLSNKKDFQINWLLPAASIKKTRTQFQQTEFLWKSRKPPPSSVGRAIKNDASFARRHLSIFKLIIQQFFLFLLFCSSNCEGACQKPSERNTHTAPAALTEDCQLLNLGLFSLPFTIAGLIVCQLCFSFFFPAPS